MKNCAALYILFSALLLSSQVWSDTDYVIGGVPDQYRTPPNLQTLNAQLRDLQKNGVTRSKILRDSAQMHRSQVIGPSVNTSLFSAAEAIPAGKAGADPIVFGPPVITPPGPGVGTIAGDPFVEPGVSIDFRNGDKADFGPKVYFNPNDIAYLKGLLTGLPVPQLQNVKFIQALGYLSLELQGSPDGIYTYVNPDTTDQEQRNYLSAFYLYKGLQDRLYASLSDSEKADWDRWSGPSKSTYNLNSSPLDNNLTDYQNFLKRGLLQFTGRSINAQVAGSADILTRTLFWAALFYDSSTNAVLMPVQQDDGTWKNVPMPVRQDGFLFQAGKGASLWIGDFQYIFTSGIITSVRYAGQEYSIYDGPVIIPQTFQDRVFFQSTVKPTQAESSKPSRSPTKRPSAGGLDIGRNPPSQNLRPAHQFR